MSSGPGLSFQRFPFVSCCLRSAQLWRRTVTSTRTAVCRTPGALPGFLNIAFANLHRVQMSSLVQTYAIHNHKHSGCGCSPSKKVLKDPKGWFCILLLSFFFCKETVKQSPSWQGLGCFAAHHCREPPATALVRLCPCWCSTYRRDHCKGGRPPHSRRA